MKRREFRSALTAWPFCLPGSAAIRGWAALASFAGTLAIASGAHAAVVVSPASNIAIPSTSEGVYVNVVSGSSGIVPEAVAGWQFNFSGLSGLSVRMSAGSLLVQGPYGLQNLSPGAVVDQGFPFSTSGAASFSTGTSPGYWRFNTTNFFGFQFVGDDAQQHYGYATVVVGASYVGMSVGHLYYESLPNAPITISPVPEPAGWILLIVGVAGIGTRAWRRCSLTS